MATYQITGECAHVLIATPTGPTSVLLYKGAILPPDTTQERIDDLLSKGLVVKVDAGNLPVAPNSPVSVEKAGLVDDKGEFKVPPVSGVGGGPEPAKVPDGKSTKAELVDYLVAQGGDRTALSKSEKADLLELVNTRKG